MNAPPPGWYPDPVDPRTLRWFDGQRWTDGRSVGAPSPRRSGARVAIIVGICAVVGLFTVSILAAVAIPVFLNQREKASLAELSSLGCEDVASNAVSLSLPSASGDTLLVGMTGSVLMEDERARVRVPDRDGEAFVMSCSGVAQWGNGNSSPVMVEVYLDADRMQVYYLDEG